MPATGSFMRLDAMMKLKSFLRKALLCIALLSLKSDSSEPYYIGVNMYRRFMGFKAGFGDSHLKNSFSQIDIYFGYKFNRYFGIECGYEETLRSKRKVTLHAGDMSAGMPIHEMFSPVTLLSTIKIQGPHISIVGFYPAHERLEFFASMGISFLKGASTRTTLLVAGYLPRRVTRTMVGRKQLPRLFFGSQYQLIDNLWIRAAIGWVPTHKLLIRANDKHQSIYTPQIKPRSSRFIGIGLVWDF